MLEAIKEVTALKLSVDREIEHFIFSIPVQTEAPPEYCSLRCEKFVVGLYLCTRKTTRVSLDTDIVDTIECYRIKADGLSLASVSIHLMNC